ncbi:MAG: hypothetical protein KJ057_03035 [Phycisphaerae bacterium]|nr:MAG: hypothetical protein F9K17_16410 [Phycisphaerae bacterium]MCK6463858.1 hypothetical protein [Phycisphaerae bacterium]MCL4717427.1 hypothetical protein [Phycisphaerae bacterium]NUQ07570.1 hypothetical protein [Phycisphaerae bacterium]
MRTQTTKSGIPMPTTFALLAALTLSAPPLTPPAAAQCPGLFRLDWVGTNGVPGGEALDEPTRFDIALNASGELGMASWLHVPSDIDPTDAVVTVGPFGEGDGLVNIVDPRGIGAMNGRMGGVYEEACLSIDATATGGWVYCGRFSFDVSGEYCANFDPFGGEHNRCVYGPRDNYGSWVTVLDHRGRHQYTKLFAGDGDLFARAAARVPDGYVFSGFIDGTVDLDPGPGEAWFTSIDESRDAFLLRLDAQANYEWAVAIGNWRQDEGEQLAVDFDGNLYWLGRFSQTVDFDPGPGVDEHTSISGSDMFISKYTSDGAYQWTRTVNTNQTHSGTTLDFYDNKVLVAGGFSDRVDFDPTAGVDERRSAGEGDAYLSMWTSGGDYLWTRTWGGADGFDAAKAVFNPAGDIIVSGGFTGNVDFDPGAGMDVRSSSVGLNAFITKYSNAGEYQWTQTFGPPDSAWVYRMAYHKPTDELWLDGLFMGTVDFDPGPGEAMRTSVGERDLFLMKMRCAGGGCAELTGHSATGRSSKASATVTTTLPSGKAAVRLCDDAGNTIATKKKTITADGSASVTFKRLRRGMYWLTVTQLKDADGRKVCRGEFLERRVEVR